MIRRIAVVSAAVLSAATIAAPTKRGLAYPQLAVPQIAVPQSAPPLQPTASGNAWSAAAAAPLKWDVGHARPADDATTVHIATDGKFLYVRFDAQQHEALMAAQHSDDTVAGGSNINGGIAWTDDAVWVDLWPTGPAGFQYQFESNPNGAHNEASTENTAFAPQWESHGAEISGGYVVTMAIPLGVIHGAHPGTWRAQFVRYVRSTGALNVWSYDEAQNNPDDPTHAGQLAMTLVAKPPLPRPRIGTYALGELASAPAGGSTSRVGADFSIPVAQTAAVFGTLHPDYSNVEIDQQTIAPSVYQRVYSEVRPFFTQAAPYYNTFNCDVCNGFRTTLYTPAIPTPAQGYAFEGREGLFGLAAFDAIGDGRNDAAAALDYTSDDNHWNASLQQVVANIPGVHDVADEAGVSWFNGKYLSAYADYATDRGTNVLDPRQGNWLDFGGGFVSQQYALFGSFREVGTYFNPVDGFDSHPGITGYGLYGARVWTFAPKDFLSSIGVSGFLDRYQGPEYGQAQSDNQVLVDFLTKGTIDLQLYSGSDYWRFGTELTPISQNAGFSITYHSGMQNNLNNFPTHGSSATPTSIQWYTGNYGPGGRLDTWFRNSTIRVGNRGSLTLTLDDTAQYFHMGSANIQWFEEIAYAYQIAPNSSFAIGVRHVIGYPPQPNGGGNCVGACSNISVAYHLRLRNTEFYLAYGNPNTLVTVPQTIFKIIFYAGGAKGT
ncbi:MAG: hypothetical protein JO113_08725 [Candidatus Eremiobacteraeota bacterium]|nr:hypothetical protein [Candidatus Eremiobacteraeota bacterium]